MDVILLERIEKLGQMGDLVRVKNGYARNYLLPTGKALRATEANRERFERERVRLEAQNLERRAEAEDIAGRMGGLAVTMVRQAGDAGQLYGSVNGRDVAEAEGIVAPLQIGRQQVQQVVKTGIALDRQGAVHPGFGQAKAAGEGDAPRGLAVAQANGDRRPAAVAEFAPRPAPDGDGKPPAPDRMSERPFKQHRSFPPDPPPRRRETAAPLFPGRTR